MQRTGRGAGSAAAAGRQVSSAGTQPPASAGPIDLEHLAQRIHQTVYTALQSHTNLRPDAVRALLPELIGEFLTEARIQLSATDRTTLTGLVEAEVLGLGPIQPYIDDNTITEVMVNGPDEVYIERDGHILPVTTTFRDHEHLRMVIDRIVADVGRRVDESSPLVDARLPDGSRVNVIVPPLAMRGPYLTIRKFPTRILSGDDLVSLGAGTVDMLNFLCASVRAKLNILITGGSSSGKTTLLNVLSGFISDDERIVTIEDAAELRLQQRHVLSLESRPSNLEGMGQVTIRDLVRNALRMRPDRIIVGEVRGAEALDMLQAMNTGHEGSMSTLHANNPQDALSRLEVTALMGSSDLSVGTVRQQIGSTIHLVVQTSRVQGGMRKIVEIAEVKGVVGGSVVTTPIFVYEQTGVDEHGAAIGSFAPTGNVPQRLRLLAVRGQAIDPAIFKPRRP